jgi:hypothetical protein
MLGMKHRQLPHSNSFKVLRAMLSAGLATCAMNRGSAWS